MGWVMQRVVSGVITRSKRVLLVKKKDVWILPGGKKNEGESDLECLAREIREELSGTELGETQPYIELEGTTPHSRKYVCVSVLLAEVKGALGRPSAEISDSKFVGYQEASNYRVSEITTRVLNMLSISGYIE